MAWRAASETDLLALGVEEGIRGDEQRTDFHLRHRREGWFELLLAGSTDDLNLLSKFLCSCLQFRGLAFGDWTTFIHQCGDYASLRH